jgi:hypothetical protein
MVYYCVTFITDITDFYFKKFGIFYIWNMLLRKNFAKSRTKSLLFWETTQNWGPFYDGCYVNSYFYYFITEYYKKLRSVVPHSVWRGGWGYCKTRLAPKTVRKLRRSWRAGHRPSRRRTCRGGSPARRSRRRSAKTRRSLGQSASESRSPAVTGCDGPALISLGVCFEMPGVMDCLTMGTMYDGIVQ